MEPEESRETDDAEKAEKVKGTGETNVPRRRVSRSIKVLGFLFVILFLAVVGTLGYFHFAPPELACLSCHEIRPAYEAWTSSAHREMSCQSCHDGALTSGIHGLKENASRLFGHFSESTIEDIRLSEEQVVEMQSACRSCHQNEYAKWRAGRHAVSYADVFLDEQHNTTEQPSEDCLRCHGMFFAGAIADVVKPLSVQGPWRLVDSDLTDRPAIPCLACHEVHRQGEPVGRRRARSAERPAATSPLPAKVDFYVRAEKRHFRADDLPRPRVHRDGEPVAVSPDAAQRVCTQCHAPASSLEAGTSDDRTPRGVHAGLSCLACHDAHSHESRDSCDSCHPALSNCGLDVREMDTSYRSRESEHDIHFVSCTGCHADGVPDRSSGKRRN